MSAVVFNGSWLKPKRVSSKGFASFIQLEVTQNTQSVKCTKKFCSNQNKFFSTWNNLQIRFTRKWICSTQNTEGVYEYVKYVGRLRVRNTELWIGLYIKGI